MPQEFLASFAVEIDEAGVSRLERILENNRELARKLADAFDEARGAMEGLLRPLTEDMEGILPFPRPEAAETPYSQVSRRPRARWCSPLPTAPSSPSTNMSSSA